MYGKTLADVGMCKPSAAQAALEIAVQTELNRGDQADRKLIRAFSKASEYAAIMDAVGMPFLPLVTDKRKIHVRSRNNSDVYHTSPDTCTCPHGEKGAAGDLCWHRALALAILAVGLGMTIHQLLEGESIEVPPEDIEALQAEADSMHLEAEAA